MRINGGLRAAAPNEQATLAWAAFTRALFYVWSIGASLMRSVRRMGNCIEGRCCPSVCGTRFLEGNTAGD